MREHEVPTHVQAEDKVLLWFTFPQIVAVTAVCAISYGVYRYAPVGPSEVRIALAVVLGLAGVAMIVGQIGGRRLPLVAADLLKYRLGARLYAGPPSQLVRSEPPASVQPARSGPGPLRVMASSARRGLRRLRRKRRKDGERRNGRMPFRPHGWFGKGRKRKGHDHRSETQEVRNRKGWFQIVALVVLAAVVTVPQAALADGHEGGGWSSDEIEFQPTQPVDGRRLYIEGLSVTGDRAKVTLRAATDLDVRVRAFGGQTGSALQFRGSSSLDDGERIDYDLPLEGETPSLTFSWEDSLGQAGAVTVKGEQIPYPLPAIDGELCDLRVVSLGWTPGRVEGAIESECVAGIEEAVSVQTVAGHASVTETALMDAAVTSITGSIAVGASGSPTNVSFVPDGETRFSVPVPTGEAIHGVTVEVGIEAALRIPMPPLVQLTHHPERTEIRTQTVSMLRPGTSETVSETVNIENPDGTFTRRTISATLSIPSEMVQQDVTLTIVHPERVEAEVVERSPITWTRGETLTLASDVGSDDPFEALVLPQPEPEDQPAEQEPADGLRQWFDLLEWEWPW